MRHSRISVVARESLSGWAQSSHVRAAFAGTVDEFRGFLEEQIHSTGAAYFVCDLAFGDRAPEESLQTGQIARRASHFSLRELKLLMPLPSSEAVTRRRRSMEDTSFAHVSGAFLPTIPRGD